MPLPGCFCHEMSGESLYKENIILEFTNNIDRSHA